MHTAETVFLKEPTNEDRNAERPGSTFRIRRMIADKIEGENEITEFFFPKHLPHFCER